MNVTIRPLTLEDASDVERLYGQSIAHLRALGDDSDFQFSADVYRRDGFGERPAFEGIGAELRGRLVGYLIYSFGYDTDHASRYIIVIDLAVDETVRRQGIGKALMTRAAALCREGGGDELFWAVYEKNESALSFYRRLGARDVDFLQFMRLDAGAGVT